MKRHSSFSEADLAAPLYQYLSGLGYTVRSEVKDCDIAAVKGEDLLIVELKKSLSLSLIVQAAQRQRVTDLVYVAVPRPSNKWAWWQESRGVRHLLRRLEIGLILVSLDPERPPVEVVSHPAPFQRRKRPKSRRAVLTEISGRTADFNRAGSNRRKLVTAYRESAIRIACCLAARGNLSPAELRRMGTGDKTQSILHFNAYGWFERVERGVYALTAQGRAELEDYPVLKRRYYPRGRVKAPAPAAASASAS
ncbi:MAG TPA: DUF2161 family putative PD-(D/E)XK-type phosphodiesterase [Spirochaetia bacterium]|nr:DUF2161 family putative PD-(D/E)XK-type phosphodiesterase [Spirochaetia bacterium]